jgi:hypothetical protein
VPVSAAQVRYAVVTRIAVFTFDDASARDRWQNGVPAAFLPGTYWLQRFASVPVLETCRSLPRIDWRMAYVWVFPPHGGALFMRNARN